MLNINANQFGMASMQMENSKLNNQVQSIRSPLGSIKGANSEEQLREACKQFESILVKKMLDSMRKTVDKSGLLDGGRAEEIFEDMLYDKYARKMTDTADFGLSEMLFEQLKTQLSADEASDDNTDKNNAEAEEKNNSQISGMMSPAAAAARYETR